MITKCSIFLINKYADYVKLHKQISTNMWSQAQLAIKFAKKKGLNLSWYAKYASANSVEERYSKGYWLQFYIYRDLIDLYSRKRNGVAILKLKRAYYSSNWESVTKGK